MNDSGIEAVLLANQARLLRFIRARGAGGEAEDILQELWLKLRAAPATGPIADPLAYLHRMADNLMHDRRRATRRRERRDASWSEATGAAVTGVSEQPSAERVLQGREELRAVEVALASLGERTDRIFRRFRIEGVGQKSIAADEAISLSAVEKHLQRAYRSIIALRIGDDDADSGDAQRPMGQDARDVAR